jgi:secretion/DNA translocation related TadE-like protein
VTGTPWRSERGSGSLLGLAIAGSVGSIVLVSLPLYIGLSSREAVERAADAAALAGADVAAGLAPGIPCDVAGSVAGVNRVSMADCRAGGLVVTVTVEGSFLGIPLAATSTAGPPGAVTN